MSYELYINDKKGKIAQVKDHAEGGTYCIGGTKDACLNITYNYSKVFRMSILNNKKCKDCIEWLEELVRILGTDKDNDYWKPTNGNVGYCLSIILGWCKEHPNKTIEIL